MTAPRSAALLAMVALLGLLALGGSASAQQLPRNTTDPGALIPGAYERLLHRAAVAEAVVDEADHVVSVPFVEGTPGSVGSWIPSLSVSFQTLSPREAGIW